MLRAATKESVRSGAKWVRSNSTGPSPIPPPIPSRTTGKSGSGLKWMLGLTTVAAGGTIGYAYYDPEFRNKVETTIPQTKDVFNAIIGKPHHKIALPAAPVSTLQPAAIKSKEKVLPPLEVHKPPPVAKKPAVEVDAVDVHKKNADLVHTKPSEELVKIRNKQLENRLIAALRAAETHVQTASEAKLQTIRAINDHAACLKKTVDDGPNADWEKVTQALQRAEGLSAVDTRTEVDGRNQIDVLRTVISEGKSDQSTLANPLLINATESANKFQHQLDELNNLVHKARQESTILNQYKELIARSRQQFALEVKSILPAVDLEAKGKNLNEDELNALIAHAHLRVDQLRRQLTEQQLREEQHIAKAIEQQRVADEKIAQETLHIELQRVEAQKDVEVEKQVLSTRSNWEVELEDRLKRAAGAHSEHLEQVIRTQRQLFEIEHNQKVEEAVLIERSHHTKAVGQALSRLEGIETVLNSRVALDAENRRSKQFWIACHNLIDTIVHGRKAGATMDERRAPLGDNLKVLEEVNPDDNFVSTIIHAFPDQATSNGVYTELDLKSRFNKLYRSGRRTAWVDENGGSLSKYTWSYIRSVLSLELPYNFRKDDKFDPVVIDNLEVLSRAKWYVEQNDFASAIKLLHLLQGQPRLLARDWIVDARTHLETRLLVELLISHAAIQSIRSTY
ncbi:unnamed protein product, partial [Mesorhabditis belari]|uniref:MICOS complex subunit MIC60 n=1 Tax=Mesorhabditis belari TaxID=2138241 RepID=A0AAF3J516_9BILA